MRSLTGSASTPKPTGSGASSNAPPRAARPTSRSCTASVGSDGSQKPSCLLEGYRGRPRASRQRRGEPVQLDVYGELLELAWRWHQRGQSPDDDYWRFLSGLVDVAVERWEEPDHGLWETRGQPRHFVHSKIMCWVAVDRGIQLAEECLRRAPLSGWRAVRDAMREDIDANGIDADRICYVQAYDTTQLDAASAPDPRRRLHRVRRPSHDRHYRRHRDDLSHDGLLRRYQSDDGLDGDEGVFVACTFWLAECLAPSRPDAARHATRSTEPSPPPTTSGSMPRSTTPTAKALGNFPQGLSHLSHIAAAVALARASHEESTR